MAKILTQGRRLVFMISFYLVLGVASKLFFSPKVGSWIEGQRICEQKGGRLLNSDDFSLYLQETLQNLTSGSQFWIGDVQRVSEWIHIEGCYDTGSIQHLLNNPIQFKVALTPARCQEVCWNKNKSRYFAIMQEKCYCLQGVDDIKSLNLAAVAKCDYECNTQEAPRACGSMDGEVALSLYKSSNASGFNNRCIQIECSSNKRYMDKACSQTLKPFCSRNIDLQASDWTAAYSICKKENGYLDGRADLDDAVSKCGEIGERFPNDFVFWLGIRRQSFNTVDTGYSTRPDTLERCDYFDNSSAMINTDRNCATARYSVCVLPIEMERNDITSLPDHTDDDTKGQNQTAAIVGGVVGGVLACATLFIVLFLYTRWKRNRQTENRETLEVANSLSKVLDVNLQMQSAVDKNSALTGKNTEEDMYYESQNDYDILGKKRLKMKVQEDNFYNLSENPVNQNDYARADQVFKRLSDAEDMYDHTQDRDLYGRSPAIQEENVYNQSDS